MSEFRRKLLCGQIEPDIDYVKRQVDELTFYWPASIYYDSTRLHIRGYNGTGDNWPTKRSQMCIPRNVAKIPVTWWGTNGGYYLLPEEPNLSYLHLPPSINIFSFKHNASSSYQMAIDIFEGLSNPLCVRSSGWIYPGTKYTFDFSNDNNDKWASIIIRYGNNNIIPFTTSDQMKSLFNIKFEIE